MPLPGNEEGTGTGTQSYSVAQGTRRESVDDFSIGIREQTLIFRSIILFGQIDERILTENAPRGRQSERMVWMQWESGASLTAFGRSFLPPGGS